MAACTACSYTPKEVNPKQEHMNPGQVGNYVRLPYYAALTPAPGADRFFLEPDGAPMSLERFLHQVRLTSTEALADVADLWTPPVVTANFDGPVPDDVQGVLNLLSGLAYRIWRDGPLEGRDRSNTLAKLAYTLSGDDVSIGNDMAVLRSADLRWGKFFDRPDCDEQLQKFLEKAY